MRPRLSYLQTNFGKKTIKNLSAITKFGSLVNFPHEAFNSFNHALSKYEQKISR